MWTMGAAGGANTRGEGCLPAAAACPASAHEHKESSVRQVMEVAATHVEIICRGKAQNCTGVEFDQPKNTFARRVSNGPFAEIDSWRKVRTSEVRGLWERGGAYELHRVRQEPMHAIAPGSIP